MPVSRHYMNSVESPKAAPLKKALTWPLRISIVLLTLGALFELLHWPYAGVTTIAGSTGLLLLYPVRFALRPKKRPVDVATLVFLVFLALQGFFSFFEAPFPVPFKMILGLFFIGWIVLDLNAIFGLRNEANVLAATAKVLSWFAVALRIINSLFLIEHWTWAGHAQLLGLLALITYFLLGKAFDNQVDQQE